MTAIATPTSFRGGLPLALRARSLSPPHPPVIDVDEPPVVGGDLLRGVLAPEVAVDEPLQRIPPDRATDLEPDVPRHARTHPQPVIDRGVVGPAAEHHTRHAVAALAPC